MLKVTTKKLTSGTNTCEFLIFHNTGGSLVFDNQVKYLASHKDQVSAHFVVGQNENEVAQIGEDRDILWHSGKSSWQGKSDEFGTMNKFSIGIEVVGPGFTDIQRNNTTTLARELIKKYNIQKENVLRHRDIAPGRKTDIEDEFWNTDFSSWKDYVDFLYAGEYELLFSKNYGKGVVFNDLDGALKKCINKDGSLNTREFFFLTMIGLERINKKTQPPVV